jgi:flagellar biosynthesis protein FlhF
MIIKKFTAKTEKDATQAARKEMGEEAVIMNVRKVKAKGAFAFLKPQLTEVTAALEEESEKYTAALSSINNVLNASQNRERQNNATAPAPEKRENSAIEEKLDSLQSLLEQQLQKPEEEPEPKVEEPQEESETDKFMKLLHTTMLENEVDETYADQILEEIGQLNKPNLPFDYALANIYQKMILKFGKPSGITPAKDGVKAIFFIGPTGVGKTTTIAKLASKFRLDEKKKVALLTADTYRIAAAEQLRTYANILEVPFRVVYSEEELGKAVEDFKEYDYILIDTAGHSHQNNEQKENMCKLIGTLDEKIEKEIYLVLSATTKYRDLRSIADSYKGIADYKLIFTKLDETTTLGSLLNMRLYTGASLSYVTCGQNVPDDMEEFNPQKTVKRLLGGKN